MRLGADSASTHYKAANHPLYSFAAFPFVAYILWHTLTNTEHLPKHANTFMHIRSDGGPHSLRLNLSLRRGGEGGRESGGGKGRGGAAFPPDWLASSPEMPFV